MIPVEICVPAMLEVCTGTFGLCVVACLRVHRVCAPCECRCTLQGRQGVWAWGWRCSLVAE